MKLKFSAQKRGRLIVVTAPYFGEKLRSWRRKTASSIHMAINIGNSSNNQRILTG